jgi:hypothetical protein
MGTILNKVGEGEVEEEIETNLTENKISLGLTRIWVLDQYASKWMHICDRDNKKRID